MSFAVAEEFHHRHQQQEQQQQQQQQPMMMQYEQEQKQQQQQQSPYCVNPPLPCECDPHEKKRALLQVYEGEYEAVVLFTSIEFGYSPIEVLRKLNVNRVFFIPIFPRLYTMSSLKQQPLKDYRET